MRSELKYFEEKDNALQYEEMQLAEFGVGDAKHDAKLDDEDEEMQVATLNSLTQRTHQRVTQTRGTLYHHEFALAEDEKPSQNNSGVPLGVRI